MRVFGRILYALIAVGFFLLAFTYSRDLMQSRYLEEVFEASLTDTNAEHPKYYYFYSSIPDFHHDQPVISIEANGYEIYGFEVVKTSINNDLELEVLEYVYLIVYSETLDLSVVGGLYLENTETSETLDIYLQRFKTMNLMNGVNDEGYVYLPKEQFFESNYNQIVLKDKEENELLNESMTMNESDFVIKDFMESFYTANEHIPGSEDLDTMASQNIYPKQTHVADDYVHIFYIAMGIYFTALIAATYLIFFRKRKYH